MQPHEYNSILEKLQKLEVLLSDTRHEEAYHSTYTKELFIALAKAQGEFPASIEYSSLNPHFKSRYADLDSIVRKIRPILSKNGLAITQEERITQSGQTMLHTRLHYEDQWTEVRALIRPEKDNIQGYGGALSYHKRYSLLSLLFITTSNDPDDDDGESNMKYARIKEDTSNNRKINTEPTLQSKETIGSDQVEDLERILYNKPNLAKSMMKQLNITSLTYVPKSEFYALRNRLQEIIKSDPNIQ